MKAPQRFGVFTPMTPSPRIAARLLAALVLTASLDVMAYETPAQALRAGNEQLRAKDLDSARTAADKAIKLAGDDHNPKAQAWILQAQIALAQANTEAAQTLLKQVYADERVSPSIRLDAINRHANQLREAKTPELGVAIFEQWLGKPGFDSGVERLRLMLAKATYQERCNLPDEAIASYSALLAEDDSPIFFRLQALRNRGKIYGRDKSDLAKAIADFETAAKLPEIKPQDLAALYVDEALLYSQQGERGKAQELLLKAVRLEGLTESQKSGNAQHLMRLYRSDRDLSGMQSLLQELGGAKTASDYALLKEMTAVAMATNEFQQAATLTREAMDLPEVNPTHYNEAARTRAEALGALREREELAALSRQVAEHPKSDATTKTKFALISWAFGQTKDLNPSTLPKPQIDGEALAGVYADVGKLFLRMRDNQRARFFDLQSASMFEDAPKVSYNVPFVSAAPIGVSGWEASDIVKDSKRRESRFQPYNKAAAAKLVVDVNAVRDVVTEGAQDGAGNASFFAAADPRGLHFFIDYKEDKSAEVFAGLERGGGLEIYLRPGNDAAYYQMSVSIPGGETTFYPWMSPHRHYRNLDSFVQTQVGPIKGGIGTYLFVPWDVVYDKLPSADDQWTFGLINFSRAGGFTWGSGQVHELERFGRLQFKGIGAQLPSIRRQIVLNAFGRYKAKVPGIRRYWNDEVKGDRVFFATVLEPRLKALDEAGATVSSELSDGAVTELFEKLVPEWMEVDYLVSELRSAYLKDQFFGLKHPSNP